MKTSWIIKYETIESMSPLKRLRLFFTQSTIGPPNSLWVNGLWSLLSMLVQVSNICREFICGLLINDSEFLLCCVCCGNSPSDAIIGSVRKPITYRLIMPRSGTGFISSSILLSEIQDKENYKIGIWFRFKSVITLGKYNFINFRISLKHFFITYNVYCAQHF